MFIFCTGGELRRKICWYISISIICECCIRNIMQTELYRLEWYIFASFICTLLAPKMLWKYIPDRVPTAKRVELNCDSIVIDVLRTS